MTTLVKQAYGHKLRLGAKHLFTNPCPAQRSSQEENDEVCGETVPEMKTLCSRISPRSKDRVVKIVTSLRPIKYKECLV